jgi:hypothetical protein
MYPSHLVDESEIKYQKWFALRYAEVEAVRSSKDYLNSFLRQSIEPLFPLLLVTKTYFGL